MRWTMGLVLFSIVTLGFSLLLCASARAECVAKPGSIFVVTDREALNDDQLFSGEWGNTANGESPVTIGVLTEPIKQSDFSRCSSRQAFINALRSQFEPKRPRQVLVYVHGYYTSFVDAAQLAIALKKGLQFPGPVILYSWPARKTSVTSYARDEKSANWSMPHFIAFLKSINKAFPGMPVSFAGYSLGSRFVTDAIAFYHREGCNNCFGRAVLFAPDVSASDLRKALVSSDLCSGKPPLTSISSAPVLLYASNDDRALRQSQRYHRNQRAGQAGADLIICKGVDTIDVSYLNSGGNLGHGYLLDPKVLQDAAAAFAGVPPSRRDLKQVSRESGVYYELLASP